MCNRVHTHMCDTGFVIKLEESSHEDNDSVRKQYKILEHLFVGSLLVAAYFSKLLLVYFVVLLSYNYFVVFFM